ncbi:MAG: WD40 repeat domain-containing protein, partial [Promethearchaeota archaeon]
NTFEGHSEKIRVVQFSPDGNYILSGSGNILGVDCSIRIWEIATSMIKKKITWQEEPISSMILSPYGKYIICGLTYFIPKENCRIFIYDYNTEILVHILEGHKGSVDAIALSPNGKFMISASLDNTIKLWELHSWKLVETLQGHEDAVRSVAFSPDGNYIFSGSWDKTVKIWNFRDLI